MVSCVQSWNSTFSSLLCTYIRIIIIIADIYWSLIIMLCNRTIYIISKLGKCRPPHPPKSFYFFGFPQWLVPQSVRLKSPHFFLDYESLVGKSCELMLVPSLATCQESTVHQCFYLDSQFGKDAWTWNFYFTTLN